MSIEVEAENVAGARAKAVKMIAEIREDELAVRIFEAIWDGQRPDGMTAAQALDALDEPERNAVLRAARASMLYWRECIAAAQQPN